MIVINRKERLMVVNSLKRFLKEEDGVGVVEVILILVEIFIFNISVYNVSIV